MILCVLIYIKGLSYRQSKTEVDIHHWHPSCSCFQGTQLGTGANLGVVGCWYPQQNEQKRGRFRVIPMMSNSYNSIQNHGNISKFWEPPRFSRNLSKHLAPGVWSSMGSHCAMPGGGVWWMMPGGLSFRASRCFSNMTLRRLMVIDVTLLMFKLFDCNLDT